MYWGLAEWWVAMRPSVDEALVAQFRAFNRFYTTLLGALRRDYLDSALSLPEARVLFEIAAAPDCTARDVQGRTGMDQGQLSRLLARLEETGHVGRRPDRDDRRVQRMRLTAAGRAAFEDLSAAADRQAAQITGHLTPAEQADLSAALARIRQLLEAEAQPPIEIREHRPGDAGWVLGRHAEGYAQEYDYTPLFETYVADGLTQFLRNHDPARDRLWIAQRAGARVGSVAIQHDPERPGWAKLRWYWVEPALRGHGLGRRLITQALAFAREAGYQGVYLWTVDDLADARRVYERSGFRLVEETPDCPWSPGHREQRWELELQP